MWIRLAKAIPRSKSTPGMTAASANATPSNVLWSSLRTTPHRARPPRPLSGPPTRSRSREASDGHRSQDGLVFVTPTLDVDAVARASPRSRPTGRSSPLHPAARRSPTRWWRSRATCGSRTRILGGRFEASGRSDALVTDARRRGSGPSYAPPEIVFGANASTLNFALSRSPARASRRRDPRRSSTTTPTSPRGSSSRTTSTCLRAGRAAPDTDARPRRLERKFSERTRVVAFPLSRTRLEPSSTRRPSSSWHTRSALGLADPRPLRAALSDRRDRARRRRSALLAVQVLRPAPRPLGLRRPSCRALSSRTTDAPGAVRVPLGARFETGTLAHELLAGCSRPSIT